MMKRKSIKASPKEILLTPRQIKKDRMLVLSQALCRHAEEYLATVVEAVAATRIGSKSVLSAEAIRRLGDAQDAVKNSRELGRIIWGSK